MPVPRPRITVSGVRGALASSRARLAAALVAVLALPGAATAAPVAATTTGGGDGSYAYHQSRCYEEISVKIRNLSTRHSRRA